MRDFCSHGMDAELVNWREKKLVPSEKEVTLAATKFGTKLPTSLLGARRTILDRQWRNHLR
jgi:hypothetical protein